MLLPSGVGDVPTLNVRSDVWDCVESYTICMLLMCRLKIMPTSNLKLVISFLVLPLVLLHSFKSLSFVASTQRAPLISHVYLRLAIRPSAVMCAMLPGDDVEPDNKVGWRQQLPSLPSSSHSRCCLPFCSCCH
jgi:hypothetical protein